MATEADDTVVAAALHPPRQAADIQGTGGVLRARLEDFEVHECPAYEPDGRAEAHLLVQLTKRGVTTEDAVRTIATQLEIPRAEIGVAGKKDKFAVTCQWLSVPAHRQSQLASVNHPAFSLGPAHPHGNKLRIGHLAGNNFTLVIREPVVSPELAVERARQTLACIERDGGMLNCYGPQRFGLGADDVLRGIKAMRTGRSGRRGNMVVAGGQGALFNLYVAVRAQRGLLHTVLDGDLLYKRDTRGLFYSTEPDVDQARLDAQEIGLTGPIYGSRMRTPPEGTASAALEADVLEAAGVDPHRLAKLGRAAVGTRRHIRANVVGVAVTLAAAVDTLAPGIRLQFGLPAGTYASMLAREIMEPY